MKNMGKSLIDQFRDGECILKNRYDDGEYHNDAAKDINRVFKAVNPPMNGVSGLYSYYFKGAGYDIIQLPEIPVYQLHDFIDELNKKESVVKRKSAMELLKNGECRIHFDAAVGDKVEDLNRVLQLVLPKADVTGDYKYYSITPTSFCCTNEWDTTRPTLPLKDFLDELNINTKGKEDTERTAVLTLENAKRMFNGNDPVLKQLALDTYPQLSETKISAEDKFLELFNGCTVERLKDINRIIYHRDGVSFFEYSEYQEYFWIKYDSVWSVIQKEYGLSGNEVRTFMEEMVAKHLNIKNVQVVYDTTNGNTRLSKHLANKK
jgi:hypothetical protein